MSSLLQLYSMPGMFHLRCHSLRHDSPALIRAVHTRGPAKLSFATGIFLYVSNHVLLLPGTAN